MRDLHSAYEEVCFHVSRKLSLGEPVRIVTTMPIMIVIHKQASVLDKSYAKFSV